MPRTSAERKESLVEERTEQILDAAARLFATQGYHQTTTKQIAAEAGVSEGTIYNYFASKQDLLVAMLNRLADVETLKAEIEDALPADERTSFKIIMEERLGLFEQRLPIIQAVLPQVLADPELRATLLVRFAGPVIGILQMYMEAQIAAGRFRQFNATLHVRLVQAMFVGIMLMETIGEPVITGMHEQVAEAVTDMILYGLVPRPEGSS